MNITLQNTEEDCVLFSSVAVFPHWCVFYYGNYFFFFLYIYKTTYILKLYDKN